MKLLVAAMSALLLIGGSANAQSSATSTQDRIRNIIQKKIMNMPATAATGGGMANAAKNAYYYSRAAGGVAIGVAGASGGLAGATLFPRREFIPPARNTFNRPTVYLPRQMMVRPQQYGLQRGLRRR